MPTNGLQPVPVKDPPVPPVHDPPNTPVEDPKVPGRPDEVISLDKL